jgi:hypothetical protein
MLIIVHGTPAPSPGLSSYLCAYQHALQRFLGRLLFSLRPAPFHSSADPFAGSGGQTTAFFPTAWMLASGCGLTAAQGCYRLVDTFQLTFKFCEN